jgi:hypothetical protein
VTASTPQDSWLIVGGKDLSGDVFKLDEERDPKFEETAGLGLAYDRPVPIGKVSVKLDAGNDGFYDDKTAGLNEAYSIASRQLVAWGFVGNAAGKAANILDGLFVAKFSRIFAGEGLTKAGAAYKLHGGPYEGVILHGRDVEESSDPGNTQTTSVDALATAPAQAITGNTLANPTVVTSTLPHGLVNGDIVVFSGSNSTPVLDGSRVATVISPTTFSVPLNVTVAGTAGSFKKVTSPGGVADLHLLGLTLDGFTNVTVAVVHSADNITFVPLVTFTAATVRGFAERKTIAVPINRYTAMSWDFGGAGGALKRVTPFVALYRGALIA